ncbi:Core-2/I-Branching enzyme [Pseudobutyrivibrio sp. ACV-2]|uniref:beta-1,6-N-acetylglucosaminyltransferase n=1 Tax=Pseudobutyrivibrio sp. ACV-2 TaxID=1520801 RepID=UPI00089D344C|nr:beta-1,6-N-acetylglucosaminyltransferase [Pseudobutyrivibrio sp. ACV-2]SEA01088.1 Core-2/I-Branching enzyme [Pseudobutyrivibrio sp. ACV-2]
MSKHAYLIIAHDKWGQLQFLLDILNDSRNDFFLLVDAKAKEFDKERFMKRCPVKNLFILSPVNIYWGDYSQIEAELRLLKASTNEGKYSYYHLISAVDMPLKNQDEIHSFFEKNQGMEFVDFDSYGETSSAFERSGYYYFMQRIIGRRRKHPLKLVRDFIIKMEKVFKVNRVEGLEHYLGKGANWFSITDDFARYIVNNEEFVRNHFKETYCADEVFLQTLLKLSPYASNWYGFRNPNIEFQNLRYTDWNRGKPYTFSKDEFFECCSREEYMFARKFAGDVVDEKIKMYLEC